jgi:hypothetical protein
MTEAERPADAVLAELRPSLPRRLFGVVILAALGLSLLWIALQGGSIGVGWLIFLVLAGGLSIWLAVRLWQETGTGLVLTASVLRADDGQVIVDVADLYSVDRGVFAFKPAGGFTLVTRTPLQRGWAPGLWWRLGRRIGVGGVTHKHEGRYMADVLSEMIARRNRS